MASEAIWLPLWSRIGLVILIGVLTVYVGVDGGIRLIGYADGLFSPVEGSPSTDPRGRGATGSADGFGIGFFISFLLGGINGWMAWLITANAGRMRELIVAAVLFALLSIVSVANFISADIIFTRDAQAFLNILLAASGAVAITAMRQSLTRVQRTSLGFYLGSAVLTFCLYAFIAVPLWFTLSYLSWKLGAGKLDSLDATAKAIGAAASVAAAIGLLWKTEKKKAADATKSD